MVRPDIGGCQVSCGYVTLRDMASTEVEVTDASFARLIGHQLRAFRVEAGLSQSKLARKIDVADATIQRIEAGKDTTTATIQAVLDELGRTAAELLRSAERATPP